MFSSDRVAKLDDGSSLRFGLSGGMGCNATVVAWLSRVLALSRGSLVHPNFSGVFGSPSNEGRSASYVSGGRLKLCLTGDELSRYVPPPLTDGATLGGRLNDWRLAVARLSRFAFFAAISPSIDRGKKICQRAQFN